MLCALVDTSYDGLHPQSTLTVATAITCCVAAGRVAAEFFGLYPLGRLGTKRIPTQQQHRFVTRMSR